MDFSIRLMKIGDCKAADRLNVEAFGHQESRLEDLLRYVEIQPDGWFVAEHDGALLGTVGVVNYGAFAHIGQLAVSPQFQRQGIGRRLMEHALGWIEAQGIPVATLDATAKGYPLYLQMGFSVCDLACVHAIGQAPSIVNQMDGVYPMMPADLDELAVFDTAVFGGNRSKVLRVLLRDFPKNALIIRDRSGNIAGYLFVQGRKLGPWVASSVESADRLFRTALSIGLPDDLFAIAPNSNTDAEELFKRYGFAAYAKNRHMRLGKEPLRQREKVYGQVSFALG